MHFRIDFNKEANTNCSKGVHNVCNIGYLRTYADEKADTSHDWRAKIKYPGPEIINLLSCSTQLSTKFQPLIKTELLINEEVYCFKSLRCCIYHANN